MEQEEERNSKYFELKISVNYYKNLENITNYIAFKNNQPLNALKVSDGINALIPLILDNPFKFSVCENLSYISNDYREARYKSWLLIYKISSNTIRILGVIHGSQLPSKFKNITKI